MAEQHEGAPMFRHRSSGARSSYALGDDLRDVRALVFGRGETRKANLSRPASQRPPYPVSNYPQDRMEVDLREISAAPNRTAAEKAIAIFVEKYGTKYPKAVECPTKDHDALLAFFDLPAEHWDHLRTTNPIESVFATVRHRTVRTKGALSLTTARLIVFKLVMAAAMTWRRLKGEKLLPKVVASVTFKNGTEVINVPVNCAVSLVPSPSFRYSSRSSSAMAGKALAFRRMPFAWRVLLTSRSSASMRSSDVGARRGPSPFSSSSIQSRRVSPNSRSRVWSTGVGGVDGRSALRQN